MVFSSVAFVFFFLPVVLAAYYLAPRSLRNGVFFLAGLAFYLWGAGEIVFVLLGSVLLNWVCGLAAAGRGRKRGWTARQRIAVGIALLGNLGILAYFKYAGFAVEELNRLGWWVAGRTWFTVPDVLLPIGVSFFTFQGMSYVLDVAKGTVRALRNPVDFGMYIAMFPQLVAGPIVRFHQVAKQIRGRRHTLEGIAAGAVRFAHGLFKKVCIADTVAVIVDQAYGPSSGTPGFATAWIGSVGFLVQIYFDFSGYSDMAIGLGRMFGFRLPENFHRPYSAASMTEFWQRWHMTLTGWFREYLYLPLALRRTRDWQLHPITLLVFLLIGLWHGAEWTFLIFGLQHAIIMILERAFGVQRRFRHAPVWPRRLVTMLLLLTSIVWFRAPSAAAAVEMFRGMAGLAGTGVWAFSEAYALHWLALGAGLVSLFLPKDFVAGPFLERSRSPLAVTWRLAAATLGMAAAILLMVTQSYRAFIYFRF